MKTNTEFKKSFSKWKTSHDLIFKDDLYTQLVNTNNNTTTLDKWFVEYILFAILEKRKDFDLSIWGLKSVKEKDPIKILQIIFKEFGQEIPFKKFWPFLTKLIEYKNNGEKDMDVEYDILKTYWKWERELFDKNFEGFNKWILLVNKNVYKKQKGFKIK